MKALQLQEYDTQRQVSRLLFYVLVGLWVVSVGMFVLNRLTAARKDVEVRFYYYSPQSQRAGRVVNDGVALSGDEAVVRAYLGAYVRRRENWHGSSQAEWLKGYSRDGAVLRSYLSLANQRKEQPGRSVFVLKVEGVSSIGPQRHRINYLVHEMERRGQAKERRMSAVVHWELREDMRDYQTNPLGLEVLRYTTAERHE